MTIAGLSAKFRRDYQRWRPNSQATVIMQRLQKHPLVHFSRNNKNDAHVTISGAAGESH